MNRNADKKLKKMNTINEIANRLASLCEKHEFLKAYTELFSEHAESIDPMNNNTLMQGSGVLMERERKFLETTEIHDLKVSEPLFAGNYFCVTMSFDFTPAAQERRKVEELCIYKVENGKIVSQQFFIG
jgi:hypothetical protein